MIDFNKAIAEVRSLESKVGELTADLERQRARADDAVQKLSAFHSWYRSGPGWQSVKEQHKALTLRIIGQAIVSKTDGVKAYEYVEYGKRPGFTTWNEAPAEIKQFFEDRLRYWTEEDLVEFRLAFSDIGEMVEVREKRA